MDARYWLLLTYEQSLPLIAPKTLFFTPFNHAHVRLVRWLVSGLISLAGAGLL